VEHLLLVEKPGPLTTIQDLGRPAQRSYGVPPSGAMDRFALIAGNRLVGNADGAPALECSVGGPTLVALQGCVVAVTGADFGMRVEDEEAPLWTSFFLAAGERLSFSGRRFGARAYIAVAGGFAASLWLGSASTFLLVERGGLQGRPLRTGDHLARAAEAPRPLIAGRRLPASALPDYSREPALGALAGPHLARLTPASRRRLWRDSFEVARDSDRMGYRLDGAPLELAGRELLSLGLAVGALQVPASGRPILLMADHQTAGGYPVALGVGRAWLPLAAQLLPGDRLSFRKVDATAALEGWRRLWAGLEAIS
jgi:antagonist of KipI